MRSVGSLSALYVLERRAMGTARGAVEVQTIAKRDAVIEIVRSTYTPTLVEGVGLAEDRLGRIGDLVQRIPVCRLSYDSDFECLGDVVEAIGLDLERCQPESFPE